MSTPLYNLMRGVVDYAGLFPPASLPMDKVVANYAKYLRSSESAMLGRLVVPAMKLAQFADAAEESLKHGDNTSPWRISALVPSLGVDSGQPGSAVDSVEFNDAFAAIDAFNQQHRSGESILSVVDAVEIRTPTVQTIRATIDLLPSHVDAFLEIPHQSDPSELIQTIASAGAGKRVFAKIRTGGVTPDLIPDLQEVAQFIAACIAQNLGFKATAGLHHPIRGQQPLTYADDAPTSTMHGFLNVFVAAVVGFEHRLDADSITKILAAESAERFELTENSLRWGDYEVSSNRIVKIRETGIVSFGSCSFVEPTAELQQIPFLAHQSAFAN